MNDKYQGLFEGSDSLCVFANACRIFTEGNCRISFCNNEPSDVCYSRSTWGDRARDIEAACAPNDGGYQYPPAPELWTEVAIRLNTDWGRLSTESGYKEISIEEEKAELRTFYEATSEANEIESRQADRFSDVITRIDSYKPGTAVHVGTLPDGGAFEVSESRTETFSVSASASIGASAWDAISAETGIEVGYSVSMTNTVSITINVDCPDGTGQIYWRPLFDEYEGTLESTGNRVRIWVPKDTDLSRRSYDYQCSG
ncbi:unnamed protein product [Alternaria alternata]|nr:hypothetical protein AA0115_g7549 [Alternaria tenuissima]